MSPTVSGTARWERCTGLAGRFRQWVWVLAGRWRGQADRWEGEERGKGTGGSGRAAVVCGFLYYPTDNRGAALVRQRVQPCLRELLGGEARAQLRDGGG